MIKEELLDIVPLKESTRGKYAKEIIIAEFLKAYLPIPKLTAIVMDEASAMITSVNSLVGLCEIHQIFPIYLNIHCTNHTEQLMSIYLN